MPDDKMNLDKEINRISIEQDANEITINIFLNGKSKELRQLEYTFKTYEGAVIGLLRQLRKLRKFGLG